MLPALIPVLASAVGPILDRLIPDTAGREQARLEIETRLAEAMMQTNLEQARITATEAQHRSIFVAGWRPFIGWICGLGFFWAFLGQPLAEWIVLLAGEPGLEAPQMPTELLLEMTLAMLGLGGLRTFEKLRGVSR